MKTKLLIALIFGSFYTYAQTPIDSYYPLDGSTYAILTSGTVIDQSPSGANAVWDFTDLITVGTSIDNNQAPTPEEVTSYPNTNMVTVSTSQIDVLTNTASIYSKNTNNEVSITAVKNTEIELNFAANNATLGTFPLNFGYSYSDNLSGTYIYGTYNGTLSGTITTSVDAYGTLNTVVNGLNIGGSEAVTRLKSVQNINLNYGFLTNVGTIVQTIYSYYTSGSSTPVFRTSSTAVNVPLLSIDQTSEQMEKYYNAFSVDENSALTNTISIFPNPTNSLINIDNKSMETIKQITISDMNGRVVMHNVGNVNSLSISHLQNGIYTATIETNNNIVTQKVVKN